MCAREGKMQNKSCVGKSLWNWSTYLMVPLNKARSFQMRKIPFLSSHTRIWLPINLPINVMITSWCDVINALNGAFDNRRMENDERKNATEWKSIKQISCSVYAEMNSNCVNANGDMTIQLHQFPNGIINICSKWRRSRIGNRTWNEIYCCHFSISVSIFKSLSIFTHNKKDT